jgi:hypothetical protein
MRMRGKYSAASAALCHTISSPDWRTAARGISTDVAAAARVQLQPSGLVRSNNSFCFASASASARVTASSSEVCAESVRTENVQ